MTDFKGEFFLLSDVREIWNLCFVLGSYTKHDCCDAQQDDHLLGVCDHQWSALSHMPTFKSSELAAGQLDSGALQGS